MKKKEPKDNQIKKEKKNKGNIEIKINKESKKEDIIIID